MADKAETHKHDHDHKELDEKEEIANAIKELDLKNKIKAVALNYYLEKKKSLDEELEKEMKALTLKYEKLAEPLYHEQNKLIQGQKIPTDEELKSLDTYLKEEEKTKKDEIEQIKGSAYAIESYWLKCFQNSDILSAEMKEKDEQLIKHITNIEYKPEENSNNFSITFHFSPNDFIENQTLTKKFLFKEASDDDPYKSESTEINWKKDKNLTKKFVKKTQKNKKSGAKRVIQKEVDDESFFNFFKASELHEEEDHMEDSEDEEGGAKFERIHIDYDIARTLVDEVIPYSLEYFLGVKVPGQDDQYGSENEDLEQIDETDSNEDEKPKKKEKKKPKHKSSGNAETAETKQDKPQECKQQ